MREILFRGKRKDNGEWIESLTLLKLGDCLYMFQSAMCEITYDLQYNITSVIGKSPFFVEVIPETIGQYTGLVDKNGRKIFDGDIVRIDCNISIIRCGNYCDVGCSRCAGEEATYDAAGWYLEHIYPFCYYYYGAIRGGIPIDDYKIVGNIYDNPEFLIGEGK